MATRDGAGQGDGGSLRRPLENRSEKQCMQGGGGCGTGALRCMYGFYARGVHRTVELEAVRRIPGARATPCEDERGARARGAG